MYNLIVANPEYQFCKAIKLLNDYDTQNTAWPGGWAVGNS